MFNLDILIHFMSLASFYDPLKQQHTIAFLMFSAGGIERNSVR